MHAMIVFFADKAEKGVLNLSAVDDFKTAGRRMKW
jgi:hypothetical protein